MPNVLYFLPDVEADQVDMGYLARRGLAHAFERQPFCVPVRMGPAGGPGLVVADPGRCSTDAIGYYAGRQEWIELPGLPAPAWLGHAVGPWRPDDFARPQQRHGVWVELRGGTRWLVPVARSFDLEGQQFSYAVRLPRKLVIDRNGEVASGDVVSEWRHLWDLALRWHDVRLRGFLGRVVTDNAGAAEVALSDQDIINGVASVLAANYYLGKPEIIGLELCDDENIVRPLDELADWPRFVLLYEKKTAEWMASQTAGITSGTPGGLDSSPAIGRP